MTFKIIVALFACALPVLASAQVYTWKDANGRTHYADQPPPGTAAKPLRGNITPQYGDSDVPVAKGSAPAANGSAPAAAGSAPSANASGPKSWDEKDRDFKKRQAEKAEADAKAKKAEQEKADKDQLCTRMRNQLASMQNGRVTQAGANGEKEYLSDSQISAESDRLRSQIAQNCK